MDILKGFEKERARCFKYIWVHIKMKHVSSSVESQKRGTYSKILRKEGKKENEKGSFFKTLGTQMDIQSAGNRSQGIFISALLKVL